MGEARRVISETNTLPVAGCFSFADDVPTNTHLMVRHGNTPGNMAADDDKDKLAAPLFSSAIGICAARCGRYASEPSIFACGAGSCGCVDGALIMIWDLGSEVKYRLPHTHTVYTTIHTHYSPETANLLLLILLLSKAKPFLQLSPPSHLRQQIGQYPSIRVHVSGEAQPARQRVPSRHLPVLIGTLPSTGLCLRPSSLTL
jgi:hypothetical protein